MGAGDIWTFGSDGSPGIRVTSDPANESAPLWAPDGKDLLFLSQKKDGVRNLYRKALAGSGAESLVFESPTPEVAQRLVGGRPLCDLHEPRWRKRDRL